jgi:hypothetical protein
MVDSAAMRRYSFTLENGVRIASLDANEEFNDKQAAMDYAKLIAKDLARSIAAQRKLRVAVWDDAGKEIGHVPLVADLQ